MHKKLVLGADQGTLNFLVKQDKINNGFDVKHVIKLLYGKTFTIKDIVRNIGSSYGLKKVIAFVNYVNYLDTVILNLKALKSIGLIKYPKSAGIIKTLNI